MRPSPLCPDGVRFYCLPKATTTSQGQSPLGVRGAACLHSQRRLTLFHVVPKQDQQRQLVELAAA
jgi:hypothetical protein